MNRFTNYCEGLTVELVWKSVFKKSQIIRPDHKLSKCICQIVWEYELIVPLLKSVFHPPQQWSMFHICLLKPIITSAIMSLSHNTCVA